MFKKAGIVVGIIIFLLAGVIYWFVGNMEKQDAEGIKNPSASFVEKEKPVVETEVEKQEPQEPVQTENPQTQPNQDNQPIPPVQVVEQKQVFIEIDESALGNPIITRTEVMVVAKKKIVVMDSNYGQNDGKQMVYSLELLSGEEKISFFLNGVAYDSINVGDKLKVDYNVYKNNNGVSFPIIRNVETVQ